MRITMISLIVVCFLLPILILVALANSAIVSTFLLSYGTYRVWFMTIIFYRKKYSNWEGELEDDY